MEDPATGLAEIKDEVATIESEILDADHGLAAIKAGLGSGEAKTVSVTVQLDKFVFKTGEMIVLLDVTNSGTLANVHVAANLPCDKDRNPELQIVAEDAGGTLTPISLVDTTFNGPAETCVYHGDFSAGGGTGGAAGGPVVFPITDVILRDNGLSRAVADNVIVTITGTYE